MTFYRIYAIEADNRIAGPPVEFETPDDDAALQQARKLVDGRDIEVWQGSRRILRLRPDGPKNDQIDAD